MRVRSLIILTLFVLTVGSSTALAEEQSSKEPKAQKGMMMWSGMVGAGFLHDHMRFIIMQMSGMIRMMSQMMESGKMDEKKMKQMSEIMAEVSTMMKEIPAVQAMMDRRPDTAMKDMAKMTKNMSELMNKMAEMMEQRPR